MPPITPQDALVAAHWKGRLVRSLPPVVNIVKSMWLGVLGVTDDWYIGAGEPQIRKVKIKPDGHTNIRLAHVVS